MATINICYPKLFMAGGESAAKNTPQPERHGRVRCSAVRPEGRTFSTVK